MTRLVNAELVEPVVRGLLGAIDVDDGPTDEQLVILDAVTRHVWERSDLDLRSLVPLDAAATAEAIDDTDAARRFHFLLVLLELSRHPASTSQTDRVDEYAAALSLDGMGLEVARDLVQHGVKAARADHERFLTDLEVAQTESQLREIASYDQVADPELAAKLEAFASLPDGTLGRALLDFYNDYGLSVPGREPSRFTYVFVSHDMNHVIAGYHPVADGELALGAFQMGMSDSDVSWVLCLANLAVHEAGIVAPGDVMPKTGTLARPGVADTFALAMRRGTQCTDDFSGADHLSMAEWPLDDVRARYGVPPL